jgi:preprotein translocase subunit YajC
MKKALLFSLPAAGLFAQNAAPPQANSTMSMLIMVGIAAVFFYFILWRPEQKRRKAAEQMRSALKKGDKVTAMGLVGKIDRINEQTVVLKMVEGKIEVLKAAITDVQAGTEEEAKVEN